MISVPFFKQDTEYSCGAAVMQMVFRFYGKVFSEETLMRKLKTREDSGTNHQSMIDLARTEGLYVYVNNESSLDEVAYFIGRNIPIIVHFIEPDTDDGHYAVVIGIEHEKIVLNDPWNGEGFNMSIHDFEKRWHDEDGSHPRWIMVVSETDVQLGRQYLPA